MDWLIEMFDPHNPLLFAANLVSFIGYTLFAVASILHKKSHILMVQSGGNLMCMVGEGLISGWGGFVQDGINLIRNLFVLKKWTNKWISIILIVIGFLVGLLVFFLNFESDGYYGLLPLFATLQFSIIILLPNVKYPILKASIALNAICWAVYGLSLKIFAAVFFNTITTTLAIVSIIEYYILQHKKKRDEESEKA